jgi:hypothetical protein
VGNYENKSRKHFIILSAKSKGIPVRGGEITSGAAVGEMLATPCGACSSDNVVPVETSLLIFSRISFTCNFEDAS